MRGSMGNGRYYPEKQPPEKESRAPGARLSCRLATLPQYSIREKISYPFSLSIPLRSVSSMRKTNPTTSPPSLSTSSAVALAEPPVAEKR